ncbi:hypothetical protein [Leptolyngbya sp. FACHB-261]|uniref:hypothetical protein n=1 Tax=Leptolyngbya sp. FACHB-261 TaxID=2692806 RepID=UPI0016853436|nr:hypothetical protein [Leptolyngbya sp. FACHB-261]
MTNFRRYRHKYSRTGFIGFIGDAHKAGYTVRDLLTAIDDKLELCGVRVANQKTTVHFAPQYGVSGEIKREVNEPEDLYSLFECCPESWRRT